MLWYMHKSSQTSSKRIMLAKPMIKRMRHHAWYAVCVICCMLQALESLHWHSCYIVQVEHLLQHPLSQQMSLIVMFKTTQAPYACKFAMQSTAGQLLH